MDKARTSERIVTLEDLTTVVKAGVLPTQQCRELLANQPTTNKYFHLERQSSRNQNSSEAEHRLQTRVGSKDIPENKTPHELSHKGTTIEIKTPPVGVRQYQHLERASEKTHYPMETRF